MQVTPCSRRALPGAAMQQQHGTASHSACRPRRVVARAADVGSNDAGQRPFLRQPHLVTLGFFERVHYQMVQPDKFQRDMLAQGQAAGETMVRSPSHSTFSTFAMPATHGLTRQVFAAEAAGAVTQGLAEKKGYTALGQLLGTENLLMTKDPERHRALRALLASAFSADAVAAYLPAIQALVGRHLGQWAAAGEGGVKAHSALKLLTFDFILQVVMGAESPQPTVAHLAERFGDLTGGIVAWPRWDWVPFTPWHRALAARDELMAHFRAGLASARQQLAAGQAVPGVLGRMLAAEDEDGTRLSDDDVVQNLMLFLFAGYDTSSTTLTRCLANLQDHPRVMAGLRAEQAVVQAAHGETITAAALRDMAYADAVIRETLRRDPTVAAIVRITNTDISIGDYAVPASQAIILPLRHLAATDPRWAGATGDLDPAAFNPDRLMTPEGSKQGQQLPFGAGARYCLGAGLAMAEMKIVLALLARSYDFEADTNTAWKPALGFVPVSGLPLVLRARRAAGATAAV